MKQGTLFPELCFEIFGTRNLEDLKGREWFFVNVQRHSYLKYVKQIAAHAQPHMSVTRLDGKDYQLIRAWFCRRFPPDLVMRAIDRCVKNAERKGHGIRSMKFFHVWVEGEAKKAAHHSIGEMDWTDGGKDPFMFGVWQNMSQYPNCEFDPWQGPVPRRERKA